MIAKSREFTARKSAIVDVKTSNPELTISQLSSMVERSTKTVESWLYESKNAPELGDLYLIHNCLLAGGMAVPRALATIQQRFYNQTRAWVSKMGIENKRLLDRRSREKFIYHGNELNRLEISELCGLSLRTLCYRIKNADVLEGDDITDLADRALQIHSKKK